jgi:hypothetical protein
MVDYPPHHEEWPYVLMGQYEHLQDLRSQLRDAEAVWQRGVKDSGWDEDALTEAIERVILHGHTRYEWPPTPESPQGPLVPGGRDWPGSHPITPSGKP